MTHVECILIGQMKHHDLYEFPCFLISAGRETSSGYAEVYKLPRAGTPNWDLVGSSNHEKLTEVCTTWKWLHGREAE